MAIAPGRYSFMGGAVLGKGNGAQLVLERSSSILTVFSNDEYDLCKAAVAEGKAVCVQWKNGGATQQAQLTAISNTGEMVFVLNELHRNLYFTVSGSEPHTVGVHTSDYDCDQLVIVHTDMNTPFTNGEYQDCVDAVDNGKAVCVEFTTGGTSVQAQLTQKTHLGELIFEFTTGPYHYTYSVDPTTSAHSITETVIDFASGFIPKGKASVATLNALSSQENGWLYTLTDAGTLTDGSLAVVAGDTVAWDETNSVWYKAMDYAPRQYGTNEVHNLPTDATEADLVAGNFLAIDVPGVGGSTKKMPGNMLPACKIIDRGSATVATIEALTFKQDGWKYFVTDSGTLSAGSLAVSAGDSVAWDASNSVWYKVNQYVSVEYCHQYVSPNLFDKSQTIVGKQMGTTIDNYTDYTSRSLTPAIEIPITQNPKIYFNKFVGAVGFFDVYGTRRGAFSSSQFVQTTNGYTTPDWNAGYNIKYVQIQFDNLDDKPNYVNPNKLVVSLDEVGPSYVPFGSYPTLNGEQVRMAKDMPMSRGAYSTFVGDDCGTKNEESSTDDNGRYNTAMGVRCMQQNTSGDHCTAMGYQALQKNTSGNYNTAFGEDALFNNTTGSTNTAVGIRPMQNNTTGSKNVAIGGAALYNNISGEMNIAIGCDAGQGVTNKSGNICIGYKADVESTHENTIVIGRSQKATKSGQVVIGHKNYTIENLLFGDVIIHGTDGVDRKLVFNNDNTISWVDVTPTP